jgi:hypothetical protein
MISQCRITFVSRIIRAAVRRSPQRFTDSPSSYRDSFRPGGLTGNYGGEASLRAGGTGFNITGIRPGGGGAKPLGSPLFAWVIFGAIWKFDSNSEGTVTLIYGVVSWASERFMEILQGVNGELGWLGFVSVARSDHVLQVSHSGCTAVLRLSVHREIERRTSQVGTNAIPQRKSSYASILESKGHCFWRKRSIGRILCHRRFQG